MANSLEDAPAVILCGGLGKRLQDALPDQPKSLAALGDSTVIDRILDHFHEQGVRKFILAIGYRAQQIEDHFKGRAKDCAIAFSREEIPLGTGGALKQAIAQAPSSKLWLAANGDSLMEVDLASMRAFHEETGARLTIALSPAGNREDAGNVRMDNASRITAFSEKSGASPWINAGLYLFSHDILQALPNDRSFSLELDFFPAFVADGDCYGFELESPIIDIGTPERYLAARERFRDGR